MTLDMFQAALSAMPAGCAALPSAEMLRFWRSWLCEATPAHHFCSVAGCSILWWWPGLDLENETICFCDCYCMHLEGPTADRYAPDAVMSTVPFLTSL